MSADQEAESARALGKSEVELVRYFLDRPTKVNEKLTSRNAIASEYYYELLGKR